MKRWESGLEPWSVGRELGVEGWRRGGSHGWNLECGEGARSGGMEERWESGMEFGVWGGS